MTDEIAMTAERGNFDGLSDGDLIGWAVDDVAPDGRLEVEILVDGSPVGRTMADQFRGDLKKAGIGDGLHAFRFPVPLAWCDDEEHEVTIRSGASGQPIPGSPVRILLPDLLLSISGKIDGLDGNHLVGSVRLGTGMPDRVAVTISENGSVVASGHAERKRADGSLGFSLRLPAELCDGRAHGFLLEAGRPLAAIAIITPTLLTPEKMLADYASTQLQGRLASTASYRYEGLREQLALIGSMRMEEALPAARDVATAHDFLIKGAASGALSASFPPFAFPTIDKPTASILVPVHNKLAYTYHCLASLRLMPNETSFEVLVLDDGSSDETEQLESMIGGIRVIRNEQAVGFVRNCNAGAKHARGDYIVLLNNDTEVTPHWLDRLLDPFTCYPDVGMTGAKLIFGDGTLQEAGGILWRDGAAWNYGRGGNPHDPRFNYLREADYCSGACLALEKAFWEELGGFDDAFAPAYYEDTDLAFRVRSAGRRVLYQPLCEVIHFEGVSSGTDVKKGVKRYQAINQPKFLERWSNELRSHGMPGDNPDLNKERSYARRALMIDTEVPQPDRSAGHYAAVQEMRLLQSLGYGLTFLPENLAHLGRYNDALAGAGVETIYAPFVLSVEEFLAERGKDFDLVYVTRYHVARNLGDLIRRYCPRAKIVLNNADLHFLRLIREAMDEASPAKLEQAVTVREDELKVMREVDLTLSYNEVEQAVVLSHNLSSTRMAKCPWVVRRRDRVPGYDDRRDLAFLGGFRHLPNQRAVHFFVQEVMPLVRQEMPGVRLRIYGSHVPADFAELEADDVLIDGYVENVCEVFDGARVFVAPLLTGAGIKGKVLDTLANGTPSVLSPIAAESTGVRHGLEALIASDPQDWVSAIKALYHDRERWTAMSEAALEFVGTSYGFEQGRATLRSSLASAGIPALEGIYSSC